MLCQHHNIALGYYEKDRFLIDKFEAYLDQHGSRLDRSEMFLKIAWKFARRGTCLRASVGTVVVKDNRIVAHGYNGAPAGLDHCLDVGCLIGPDGGCVRAIHAEANAVVYAARRGVVALDGSILYSTHSPCLACARLIITAGISKVLAHKMYRDESGVNLLKEAGVSVKVLGT
jgi:dCMP deaminase